MIMTTYCCIRAAFFSAFVFVLTVNTEPNKNESSPTTAACLFFFKTGRKEKLKLRCITDALLLSLVDDANTA